MIIKTWYNMLIILAESHLTLDRFMLHSGNAG